MYPCHAQEGSNITSLSNRVARSRYLHTYSTNFLLTPTVATIVTALGTSYSIVCKHSYNTLRISVYFALAYIICTFELG